MLTHIKKTIFLPNCKFHSVDGRQSCMYTCVNLRRKHIYIQNIYILDVSEKIVSLYYDVIITIVYYSNFFFVNQFTLLRSTY